MWTQISIHVNFVFLFEHFITFHFQKDSKIEMLKNWKSNNLEQN